MKDLGSHDRLNAFDPEAALTLADVEERFPLTYEFLGYLVKEHAPGARMISVKPLSPDFRKAVENAEMAFRSPGSEGAWAVIWLRREFVKRIHLFVVVPNQQVVDEVNRLLGK